jgi:adenylyltransferase/sulfurtransferase
MFRFEVSGEKLDIPALGASLRDRASGAFTSFEGRVRDHNDGRKVDGLDYEMFEPLALSEGEAILREAAERFGVNGIHAVHRHGTLAIGDCAVWVGVVAAHRDEAFKACRYVIDALKHRLPIWKKEHYLDGTAEWVNCQHAGAAFDDHFHAHDHQHHRHEPPKFDEAAFYARQVRLPEVGAEGQEKLRRARVLIVGAGGLGSPAALMLASAGVGTIGIVEFDRLEASNLHRQVLYAAADVGRSKAELAADRLRKLNPFIEVLIHEGRADTATLPGLFAEYDIVLDCTDNFRTKYLLADAAILFGKPVVQASIHRFEGQMLTIAPGSEGGCLRCLWPEPPPEGMIGNCAEVGVLGVVPGLFGTLQAAEVLKRLLGLPGTLDNHLLIFDALTLETRRIARARDEACLLCGDAPTIRTLQAANPERLDFELDPAEFTDDALGRFQIVDLREPEERESAPLPDALQAPFSAFDAAHPPFDAMRPVLLVCATGRRSRIAAEKLKAQGWTEIYSAIGGASALGASVRRAAE